MCIRDRLYKEEFDEQLCDILNKVMIAKDLVLDSLTEDSIQILDEELSQHYPNMKSVPIHILRVRAKTIIEINRIMKELMEEYEILQTEEKFRVYSQLAPFFRVVLWQTKQKLIDRIIELQTEDDPGVSVKVNRLRAKNFARQGLVDHRGEFTVFGQVFHQIKEENYSCFRMNKDARAFEVKFVGEGAIDAGGPFREGLSLIFAEIQSKVLPLLIPSPNQKNNIGMYREKWIINPNSKSPENLKMFQFFGAFLGYLFRSRTYQVLDLPSIFWKQLLGQRPNIKDIEAIDRLTVQVLQDLENIEEKGITKETFDDCFDYCFVTNLSDGSEYVLVPNGKEIRVTFENRREFIALTTEARINESRIQMEYIRKGFYSIIPNGAAALLTWQELETNIVGRSEVDVEFLKMNSRPNGDSEEVYEFLWKALKEFTTEERVMYLKFVWGRSRLPLTSDDFSTKHEISFIDSDNETKLPIAHTCFFGIDLPRYKSYSTFVEKLRYAIYNCKEIDADNTDFEQFGEDDLLDNA
eukprot:TRINITY_DN11923_c0_g1_i3.p1 TRINITY_DN11923_c0_g1~~TRINITY_DN11923_c0_g1_i3.p1  ORF type:complete len:524 (+),score=146.30 TRINITY_DN11923_c0_g1_i3:65-1636(+)